MIEFKIILSFGCLSIVGLLCITFYFFNKNPHLALILALGTFMIGLVLIKAILKVELQKKQHYEEVKNEN